MPHDYVWEFQLEPDHRLDKPARLEELLLQVLASAGRQPELRTRVLRRADIELDPLRHTACRAGRALHLSAKEFAVLQALMRTQAVLSAEDLLQQVWDEHADPFTNVVKVTMSRLRRRLGPPAVIETVPRVGYRMSETPSGKTDGDDCGDPREGGGRGAHSREAPRKRPVEVG